jgi:hypothetical protein
MPATKRKVDVNIPIDLKLTYDPRLAQLFVELLARFSSTPHPVCPICANVFWSKDDKHEAWCVFGSLITNPPVSEVV